MTISEDIQKAITYYQDLVTQNPDDQDVLLNLAWSYERAGEYGQSIEQFHRVLDLDERDSRAYYGLGLALTGDGQYDEAIKSFVRARELASESDDHSYIVVVDRQVEAYLRRLQAVR